MWYIRTGEGGAGGHSPEKGVWGCVILMTPLIFMPLLAFTRPQLRLTCKSVHKTLIWKRKYCLQNLWFSENILQFLAPKAPFWPRFSSKKLRNLINDHLSPCFWWKSIHKPPLSRPFIRSQAPMVEIRAAHTYQKRWVPPIRTDHSHVLY